MFKYSEEGSRLGEYIHNARIDIGMSIYALGEATGISRSELTRIEEGGRKQPSLANLRKIAEALYLPVNELQVLAGYDPNPAHALEYFYPALQTDKQISTVKDFIEVISMADFLTNDDLNMIMSQVRLVIEAKRPRKN